MSSLTEQERIGLEDVFLSISSSQSFFQRCSRWGKNISSGFAPKSPVFQRFNVGFPLFTPKNSVKQNKITKLLNKIQKRRKF